MPELPECRSLARVLRPQWIGRTIGEADVRWAGTVAMPSVKKFRDQIAGQQIREVSRRAKFVNLRLTTYNLLIHLRMSGDLLVKEGKIKSLKHDRLILRLVSGNGAASSNLVFNDTRKFGRVWLASDVDEVLGALGPEPLSNEFTSHWLYDALRHRHRQLKPLLLDQTFLAGLGNIYTDEVLHMAKLHPRAISDSVTAKGAERLHRSIRAILEAGIRRNGASID